MLQYLGDMAYHTWILSNLCNICCTSFNLLALPVTNVIGWLITPDVHRRKGTVRLKKNLGMKMLDKKPMAIDARNFMNVHMLWLMYEHGDKCYAFSFILSSNAFLDLYDLIRNDRLSRKRQSRQIRLFTIRIDWDGTAKVAAFCCNYRVSCAKLLSVWECSISQGG